jgi:predicted esterase YcpF (UPF0227 family)
MTEKKILYLHGLDGSLSQGKKEVLEHCFQTVAPMLDAVPPVENLMYCQRIWKI